MKSILQKIFAPPVFEGDEARTRTSYYLNLFLWFAILLTAILLIINPQNSEILLLLVIAVANMAILKFRLAKTAAVLTILSLWIALMYITRNANGVRNSTFIGAIIFILLAGLLLDYRYGFALAVLTIIAGYWFASLEAQGILVPAVDPVFNLLQEYSVILLLGAGISYITISSLQRAILDAKNATQAQVDANKDLLILQSELEQRVIDRTTELEKTTIAMQKRADELALISEVSREVAAIQDIDALLEKIAFTIANNFGFYHVGIFLADGNNEYAVLRAANSEGGKRMLERGHKLLIGVQGVVGYVILTKRPRVALDTGADIIYFNNPDLPDTHSEVAIPLTVGTNVIGALDIQSEKTNAFDQTNITTLEILANQIGVAIQNAKLFSETREALSQSQAVYDKFVKSGWQQAISRNKTIGYQFDAGKMSSLEAPIENDEIANALQNRKAFINKDNQIAFPLELRGQVIGVINMKPTDNSREWHADDLAVLQAIADRTSLALENARLVEQSQLQASTERTISEMASRIGATTDIETIMRTTVEELSRNLLGSEIVIQLQPEAEKPGQA